jgi:hypothetical protein
MLVISNTEYLKTDNLQLDELNLLRRTQLALTKFR